MHAPKIFAGALAAIAFCTAPVRADEEAPGKAEDTEESPSEDSPDEATEAPENETLSPEELSNAETPDSITRDELNKLEPKRSRLPNHPYTHTDFTAYSLEFGEFRVGIGQIRAGILPRTQVGTVPLALAKGAFNGTAKVDFLRLGPFDLAATGSFYQFAHDGFKAHHTQLGGTSSLQVTPKWSVHLGSRWQSTRGEGIPDLNENTWIIDRFMPEANTRADRLDQAGVIDREETFDTINDQFAQDYIEARSVHLKLATDIRFNRRDSFILQASANVWSRFDTTLDIDQLAAKHRIAEMVLESLRAEGIANTYVTSAAWHYSWHRADLRLGVGLSSVPGAWLTQTADFAWRFGGETRMTERRMTRTWKHNRKDVRKAKSRDKPAPDAR